TTWRTYTGQFEMSTGTVIAKSVKKKTGLEKVINKTLAMPVDALGQEAYDGNDRTSVSRVSNKYIKVDSSVKGKNISVYWLSSNNVLISLVFLNENKQEISRVSLHNKTSKDTYMVPDGTEWILYVGQAGSTAYAHLYEIQLSNEPTFNVTNGYPLLHADSAKAIKEPYQMVTISYFPTSVQRLYRIGTTGEWLSYKEQPVKVKQGQTIYAKGIDQYGNETRIMPQHTVNVTDALGQEAYDGDDRTSVSRVSNKYIKTDSSVQGKNISVYWLSSNNVLISLVFLNENKQEISRVSLHNKTSKDTYMVPDGTEWILYLGQAGSTAYAHLYEIQLSNEPTFNVTNGYPLLHADPTKAIKEPYQMVTISYFPTSKQRLYRIGTTGEWLSYKEQPIKVNQGQTIHAKGIDQYGNETRITSQHTVNVTDALGPEAYDGDDRTAVKFVSNKYMQVDNSVQGKNIRVRWNSSNTNYPTSLVFLGINKQEISRVTRTNGIYDERYVVPNGTVWILYLGYQGSTSYTNLYEIQVSD
ncbi:MAG: hypothetical protein PHR25_05800, partial [Clostridia bacterium]|nr:hypothetical protein [Clostridia bacterium]MDD4376279.1 hypothetical protein [Clostridia bacterium]